MLWERHLNTPSPHNVTSPANFLAWQDDATSFEAIAAWTDAQAAVSGGGRDPVSVPVRYASAPLFSVLGDGAAYFGNDLSGDAIDEVPPAGWLSCEIDPATLLPGRYRINVYCTVNGLLADWVKDAAFVDVEEGDLYGTGRLPPQGYGAVGVLHHWSVSP